MEKRNRDHTQLCKKLTRLTQKTQHQASRRRLILGMSEKKKGLFTSYIYTDPFNLRKHVKRTPSLKLPDTNAFVSFWTLDLLLEAFEGNAEGLAGFHLRDAVENLMVFHDHTRAEDDPLFLFWEQQNLDGRWVSNAGNLAAAYPMWKVIDKSKDRLTKPFSKSVLPSDGCVPAHPRHGPSRSSALFCLPADFDDSALNWTLGSSLFQNRNVFPELWSAWSANNFDFRKLAKHAVEYAYRPFSADSSINAIDPRTFYAIRDFLWDVKASGDGTPDFGLLTTWASTVQGNLEGIEHYYKMPFNINNVDFSVSANFVYAAMKSAYTASFPSDVAGFEDLILDTARFLVWGIESGAVVEKPDLLLLYYPSPFLGFFFVSRTVYLLQQPLPHEPDLLRQLRALLSPTARTAITARLKAAAQCEGEYAFWDGASLSAGIPQDRLPKYHNDRKFITALSVNALLNLWVIRQNKRLNWLDQTPKEVPQLLTEGVNWLRQNAVSKKYPDHNAFFSSSVKHPDSLPFRFPTNTVECVNAPVFFGKGSQKMGSHEGHSIFAMSGVPSRMQYDAALKQNGLSEVDLCRFKRCYELDFPHWSAPSVVYALICCALTKAAQLSI
jgi:hypothetical protein